MNAMKKHGKEIEPPGGEEKSTAKAEPTSGPMTRAITPPGTAGTPITVTPYTVHGVVRFYTVGTVLVGSEQAAAESLKNQLFRPPIAS